MRSIHTFPDAEKSPPSAAHSGRRLVESPQNAAHDGRRTCRKVCVEGKSRGEQTMNEKKSREGVINVKALDALIAGHGHSPEAILGKEGLLAQLTKALVERVLGAELTHHLKTGRSPAGGEGGKPEAVPEGAANCRNGFSQKTVLGDSGEMEIALPRDRQGSFEPLLVAKWQKRLPGFDAKIIALYARGLTVREI